MRGKTWAQSSNSAPVRLSENSIEWLLDELKSGFISTRDIDPYIVSADKEYIPAWRFFIERMRVPR